eukprot:CAMPEP_0172586698 /NCGR_PEP_ID=MMETSP1068-20121228/6000_1 /TAXON_ID=35684 /ORGANISM="Pseudopedinella elastica, Strain CCMP716" /LENGTH=102 /DNA_ID=CAMNT_0013381565 /DNA_START=465 /DNA_END=773 /DNA_ORIENTATION=-
MAYTSCAMDVEGPGHGGSRAPSDPKTIRTKWSRPTKTEVDEGAQRRKRSHCVVLQQGNVEHVDLDENAPDSHAVRLRVHATDAQKFNDHSHPETTRGAALVG